MIQTAVSTVFPLFGPPSPPHFPESDADGNARESTDASRGTRVIVVDDETRIASTLVEILKGEGYDAMAASTGDTAIELARIFKPDIVLSDVILPGMNGIDVAVQISTLFPKCRVILFSGQAATLDLVRDARKHGHDFQILAKPIKPDSLLALIRR
jgi:DNA-binding NtrC family response regulator